jgi:hypothetical protein
VSSVQITERIGVGNREERGGGKRNRKRKVTAAAGLLQAGGLAL